MAIDYVSEYYSGQGKVFLAPVVGGLIQHNKARWVGNVPELTLETAVETKEHKESWSGSRTKDLVLTAEKSLTFKAKLEEFTKENLTLAFQADAQEVQSGKATDEASAQELKAGDVWFLANRKISALTIKDSASSSAKTLEAGKHYTVDETFGRVELINLEGLTLPLKASYSFAQATRLDVMKTNVEGWYLRFEGLNTAKGNTPVLVELYKTDLSPAKTLSLINDELGSFELEGKALLHNGSLANIELL